MKIECNPAKDKINQKKHGISLAAAAGMDWSRATIIQDERYDYGEDRYWVVDYIDNGKRLYILACTMQGQIIRAISLRKANKREVKRYGKQD
ncbi:MAG: hypothetical protein DLM68_06505 [Hyphomicrobiales bacterium]|nr:MAG: hypothetical protein DLM68_06505 [Hyphomicrobiales bacterium]